MDESRLSCQAEKYFVKMRIKRWTAISLLLLALTVAAHPFLMNKYVSTRRYDNICKMIILKCIINNDI